MGCDDLEGVTFGFFVELSSGGEDDVVCSSCRDLDSSGAVFLFSAFPSGGDCSSSDAMIWKGRGGGEGGKERSDRTQGEEEVAMNTADTRTCLQARSWERYSSLSSKQKGTLGKSANCVLLIDYD